MKPSGSFTTNAIGLKPSGVAMRIIDFMRAEPGWHRSQTIAKGAGASRVQIAPPIYRLTKRGWLLQREHEEKTEWKLAPQMEEVDFDGEKAVVEFARPSVQRIVPADSCAVTKPGPSSVFDLVEWL